MQISLDEILTAVLAILLAGLLQSYLPETLTEVEPLALLNDPLAQVAIIALGAYLVLSPVALRIRRRLNTRRRTAHFGVIGRRVKPTRIDSSWEAEKFGVTWPVLYGRRTITGDPYAYAEDPRCPRCETELMTDKKTRKVRSDKPIWKCPGCGFTKARPKGFLYEERDAVERTVEREARQEGRR